MKLPGHKKRKHVAADIQSRAGRLRAERELTFADHGFLRERIGDLSEVVAMKEIFTSGGGPMISSTKALTGHGLSLSSLLESGICMLAFKHGFVPGSAHIKELMPEAETLNIIRESKEERVDFIMSNSSGFGGANTSLVFRACRG